MNAEIYEHFANAREHNVRCSFCAVTNGQKTFRKKIHNMNEEKDTHEKDK